MTIKRIVQWAPRKPSRKKDLVILHENIIHLETFIAAARATLHAAAAEDHGLDKPTFWEFATTVQWRVVQHTQAVLVARMLEYDGTAMEYRRTDEARGFFARIRAQKYRLEMVKKHREAIWAASKSRPATRRFCVSEALMALFTTSPLGLNTIMDETTTTAATKKAARQQHAEFRNRLVGEYNSLHSEGMIWCCVLGEYIDKRDIRAVQPFPSRHGESMARAIFGGETGSRGELFDYRNGLLLVAPIARFLDAGVLAIVPDVRRSPRWKWLSGEYREYELRIINKQVDGEDVLAGSGWKLRELDGRRLSFRSDARPDPRFLFYHYCVQLLRQAWRAAPDERKSQRANAGLRDEEANLFWDVHGDYICADVLPALGEVLGCVSGELLRLGASKENGVPGALVMAAVNQISGMKASDGCESDDGS